MNTVETIFTSSSIVSMILVPVLRELSAVLFAIAISKNCAAKKSGSKILWGLFTLIAPVLSGILYFIYSRTVQKEKPDSTDGKRKIKSSKKLTVWAIIIYIISLIIAVISIVTTTATGAALVINDDGTSINSFKYNDYYDMNGKQYDSGEKVILYDRDGNSYHIEKSPNGINYYTYFDQAGTEYDLDLCYISKDGYFYYDEDSLLTSDKGVFTYEYDKIYRDDSGGEYEKIGEYVFFDKDGNIINRYTLGRGGAANYYAFDD